MFNKKLYLFYKMFNEQYYTMVKCEEKRIIEIIWEGKLQNFSNWIIQQEKGKSYYINYQILRKNISN